MLATASLAGSAEKPVNEVTVPLLPQSIPTSGYATANFLDPDSFAEFTSTISLAYGKLRRAGKIIPSEVLV
jgi:hypothetical protein